MARYYLLAAVIVVTFGSIVFAHRLVTHDWRMRTDAHATRGPARTGGNGNAGRSRTPDPFFDGEGQWVLSALPDCFTQLSSIVGPSRALVFHVPPPAQRIPPGTILRFGPCRVNVRPDEVWVTRGRDRLRVPPRARLYRTRAGLTLVAERDGRTDVRVYSAGTR